MGGQFSSRELASMNVRHTSVFCSVCESTGVLRNFWGAVLLVRLWGNVSGIHAVFLIWLVCFCILGCCSAGLNRGTCFGDGMTSFLHIIYPYIP